MGQESIWDSRVQYSLRPTSARAPATTGTRIVIGVVALVPAAALQLLAIRHGDAASAARSALILSSVAAGLIGYLLFVHHVEHRRVSELSIQGSLSQLSAGLALGGLLFFITAGVLALAGALRIVGTAPPEVLLRPLLSAIAAGVLEELLFRGVLLRLLEEAIGSWLALALSAGLFGVFHLLAPHSSLSSIVAIMLEAGMLLGSAYFLTRRLWLPIGLHIGWNFTQGGVFGIAVSGHPSVGLLQAQLSGPGWLSGGVFGAEASVAAIAVCLIVALLLLSMAARHGQLRRPPWAPAR